MSAEFGIETQSDLTYFIEHELEEFVTVSDVVTVPMMYVLQVIIINQG